MDKEILESWYKRRHHEPEAVMIEVMVAQLHMVENMQKDIALIRDLLAEQNRRTK